MVDKHKFKNHKTRDLNHYLNPNNRLWNFKLWIKFWFKANPPSRPCSYYIMAWFTRKLHILCHQQNVTAICNSLSSSRYKLTCSGVDDSSNRILFGSRGNMLLLHHQAIFALQWASAGIPGRLTSAKGHPCPCKRCVQRIIYLAQVYVTEAELRFASDEDTWSEILIGEHILSYFFQDILHMQEIHHCTLNKPFPNTFFP